MTAYFFLKQQIFERIEGFLLKYEKFKIEPERKIISWRFRTTFSYRIDMAVFTKDSLVLTETNSHRDS